MSGKRINLEVNGVTLEANPGQMLIEVTDKADIYIPRFCYHEKLSIAANCRMCLVEVEGANKPIPACSTPVAPDMKVHTRSAYAIAAQKATMEFLLINHPLDCPICDQGGECELQDLAMGYGRDVSRFSEGKRSVKDENLGPLVSTDMTRCIHCTRCVRFGEEIAGIQELGTMGRGEHMRISTYVAKTVDHELSGNIIDLCPVGALNNKPYRFAARAWEMEQRASIAPHDCVGSNIYAHVLRGTVKRVVPRPNEAVNETWLSDRDRFSYEGIYSKDRLKVPMVKENGVWQERSWEDALEHVALKLRQSGADIGALVSPSSTCEEAWIINRLFEHAGSAHLDSRLRRTDFHDQNNDPAYPSLGVPIAELEQQQGVLLIGSDLRCEAPILAHRLRKAALKGCNVGVVNAIDYPYLFPVADTHIVEPDDWCASLAGLVVAAGGELPPAVASMFEVSPSGSVDYLKNAPSLILLGQMAQRHPAFGMLRYLAAVLAQLTGATLGYVTDGSNTAGVSLAGVLPHRSVGGQPRPEVGDTVLSMRPKTLLLVNVESVTDLSDRIDRNAMRQAAETVVALTPYAPDTLLDDADVLLPIGTWAETSGTFVNVAGVWQSFTGVANPVGLARPAWKVLRVLANLLKVPDSDYESSVAVLAEMREHCESILMNNMPEFAAPASPLVEQSAEISELEVSLYQSDNIVRRAAALQNTQQAARERPATFVSSSTAEVLSSG